MRVLILPLSNKTALNQARQIWQYICLCFVIAAAINCNKLYAATLSEEDDIVFKVMTFNTRHGTDLVGENSIDKQVTFIKQQDVDLLALQEVDQATKRVNKQRQANYFAQALSLNSYFQPFMAFDDGEYGIAALSKAPILASKTLLLPQGLEPRSFPQLLVEINQQSLLFVPIHFDWPSDDTARLAQAKSLLAQLQSQLPVVLAGDFNDYPDSRTLALFKAAGFAVTLNNTSTFLGEDNSGNAELEIDFIAVKSSQTTELSILESFVFNQLTLSDHAPVIASIMMRKR